MKNYRKNYTILEALNSDKNQTKTHENIDHLKKSICENVEKILNNRSEMARKKTTFATPYKPIQVYGMSDYSLQNLSVPAVINEFVREAKYLIEAFEPRIKNVSVFFDPSNSENAIKNLHLKISGTIVESEFLNKASPITFQTTFLPFRS